MARDIYQQVCRQIDNCLDDLHQEFMEDLDVMEMAKMNSFYRVLSVAQCELNNIRTAPSAAPQEPLVDLKDTTALPSTESD